MASPVLSLWLWITKNLLRFKMLVALRSFFNACLMGSIMATRVEKSLWNSLNSRSFEQKKVGFNKVCVSSVFQSNRGICFEYQDYCSILETSDWISMAAFQEKVDRFCCTNTSNKLRTFVCSRFSQANFYKSKVFARKISDNYLHLNNKLPFLLRKKNNVAA